MAFLIYALCEFCSIQNIWQHPLPSSLLELSMDKRNSDHFNSRRIACQSSNSSYNSTESSLHGHSRPSTTLHGFSFFACTRSDNLTRTWYYWVMVCNQYYHILVVTLDLDYTLQPC